MRYLTDSKWIANRKQHNKLKAIYLKVKNDISFDLEFYISQNHDTDEGNLQDFEVEILKRYCQKSYLGDPPEDECIICYGQYTFQDKITVFPGCGHRYNTCCLEEWLKKENTCPMCRNKIRSALLREIKRVHSYQQGIELAPMQSTW
jgi:hypothetical protein